MVRQQIRVVGRTDGTTWLWSVSNDRVRMVLRGHKDVASCVTFSPAGTAIATGSFDGTVRVWNTGSGRSASPLHVERPVGCIAVSSDGRTLAVGSHWDGRVGFRDVVSSQLIRQLPADPSRVLALAISPHGCSLVTTGDDRAIKLWRTSDGACVGALGGFPAWINALAFAPDGYSIAAGSTNGGVGVWNLAEIPIPQSETPDRSDPGQSAIASTGDE